MVIFRDGIFWVLGYGKKMGVGSWGLYPTVGFLARDVFWLVAPWATPLKNMKVSWDCDIPNIWENKIDVPNHQPEMLQVSQ